MAQIISVAATSLNQWAMDFEGNLKRIKSSIVEAKASGAKYRFGCELDICGYSSSDHFFEQDTTLHSWEIVRELIVDADLNDIIIDVGMPVSHRSCLYNCRVIILDGKILGIVPKKNLGTVSTSLY